MIDISVLQYSTLELLEFGKLLSVASYPSYNDFKYMGHGSRALFSPGEWGDSPQELFKSHRKY